MAGYKPLYIRAMETGLVQTRQDFILPDDAYPTLENAFVWRERIKRKKGCQLLGRLQRILDTQSLGDTIVSGVEFNLFTQINLTGSVTDITQADPGEVTTGANHLLQDNQYVTLSGVMGMTEVNGKTYKITVTAANKFTIVKTTDFTPYVSGGTWVVNDLTAETNKTIVPGTVAITMPGPIVFTDQGNGTLTSPTMGNSGVINYITGNVTLTTTAGAGVSTVTFAYNPNLPVMGLLSRELNNTNNEQMVAFDTTYAYVFTNQFEEFIPGTTWTGTDYNFFWNTNYWVGDTLTNRKLFWVTNFSGILGDPIRYTDGLTWTDFAPTINAANDLLNQCLAILPFRGRLVTFNTFEGTSLAGSLNYPQRIRWSQIGNPLTSDAWRDDIRGKGGFLDIPTAESIISVGFVRDNLVIYCERSTWQLRYTGRSIQPFQIEKVNSELGAESTFSAIQFDTSLVGIGDKGIVECDSFKSQRIDLKIPDLVFQFRNTAQGPQRVYGIRDFIQRLAYWSIPYDPGDGFSTTYPNRRLVYNYENQSWAIFTDSFTCYGTYQPQAARRWSDYTNFPADVWENQSYPWIDRPTLIPVIAAGNQQGFVEILDQFTTNDDTLYISGITGNSPTSTSINCVNHNLQTGYVIQISEIPMGTGYNNLNEGIFSVVIEDADNFFLYVINPETGEFDLPQVDTSAVYIGGGVISIRDNFNITSKKFNFLDLGQNIQFGYLDVLMDATEEGGVTLYVYLDYNDNSPINVYPQNQDATTTLPDTFFNSVVPTTIVTPDQLQGSKYWQRVFCNVRGAFVTIQWTLNNFQMVGPEQESNVQIDSQILWMRPAGNQLPVGI